MMDSKIRAMTTAANHDPDCPYLLDSDDTCECSDHEATEGTMMDSKGRRYEVATREHGCPIVQRGPAEGLPDFPRSKWTRITPRPLGLARAKALADAQDRHAVVCVWQTAETVYDNGQPPAVPTGWRKAH